MSGRYHRQVEITSRPSSKTSSISCRVFGNISVPGSTTRQISASSPPFLRRGGVVADASSSSSSSWDPWVGFLVIRSKAGRLSGTFGRFFVFNSPRMVGVSHTARGAGYVCTARTEILILDNAVHGLGTLGLVSSCVGRLRKYLVGFSRPSSSSCVERYEV